jgi:hypothetical protein
MTSGAGEFSSLSLFSTRWPLALASGHLIPGAANLKFLSVSLQVLMGTSNSKAATQN